MQDKMARLPAAAVLLAVLVGPAAGADFTQQNNPDVAWGDGVHLVVWSDRRSESRWEIYAARVSAAGEVLDPDGLPVAGGPSGIMPAVSFGAGVFLVVWHEGTAPEGVRAARVTPSGVVMDSVPIVVSDSNRSYSAHPAVTFDGTNFLVVWNDDRDDSTQFKTYAARVTPGGAVLDPEGFLVSSRRCDWARNAVAAGAGVSLVTWLDLPGGTWEVWGARIAPDGTVLDSSGIPVAPDSSGAWSPSIAFDGDNFLVAMSNANTDDIHAAFVSPAGAVVAPFVLIQEPHVQYNQDVAFDGSNFLVVWEGTDPYPFEIRGARVATDGTVLDTARLRIGYGAGTCRAPRVSFDGANYLVAWHDDRFHRGDDDIYAARVTPSGDVLDPGGFPVCLLAGVAEQRQVIQDRLSATLIGRRQPLVCSCAGWMLDASGRKVAALHPGTNDVRAVAPGVYFVTPAQTQAPPRKVVVE